MSPLRYLLPLAAYFCGSVPFGFLMARWIKGVDIREVGSGNIGATNAARVLGWRFFPVVFLLDFGKGFLPTLAARLLLAGDAAPYDPHPLVVCTGLAAILGHVFSVFLRFKGGKAVATGAGAFVVLAPWSVLVALLVWLGVFAIWRYVSLASMCAVAALAVSTWAQPEPLGAGLFRTAFVTLGALLVIALHLGNIKRLLAGKEHKVRRAGDGRRA